MTFTTIDQSITPALQLNIIDNGGMEIWQRGITFSNPVGYTADRWNISTSCTTYSIAQESTIVDSGVFSMKLVITTAAGGVFRIGQSPENPTQYIGKTMSYSARVKSNIAGVKLFVSYSGGQTASTIGHTGDNTWQTLSMTITLPNAGLTFSIGFDSVNTTVGTSVSPSNGTFYVDGVSMVAGSNPAAYIPLPLQQDLARCQRYYYRFGQGGMIGGGQCFSTTQAALVLRFPMQMRTSPTLNVVGTGGSNFQMSQSNSSATNVTATSTGSVTPDAFQIVIQTGAVLTAGNATYFFSNTTAAYIEASADF